MSEDGRTFGTPLPSHSSPNVSGLSGAFDPHQIVDLMASYYRLLASMRYFSASLIKYAPHEPPIDASLAASLGMDTTLISILESLPYVDGLHNEDEFILQGSFADFRKKRVLEQSRDPLFRSPTKGFDGENGEYICPWVLALTECGNRGSCVYYNTRNGHITLEDFYCGSADPFFQTRRIITPAPSANKNSLDNLPSRPAKELLEDFMNRHRTLEWIPFHLNAYRIFHKHDPEHADLKRLFEYYGWPNNFEGDAFDVAADRWRTFNRVHGLVEHTKEKVEQGRYAVKEADKRVKEFSARRINGVWDGNPDLPADEVENLEEELEQVELYLQWDSDRLAETMEEIAEMEAEGDPMEWAWKKQITTYIDWISSNLQYSKREEGKFEDEEQTKKMEEEIRGLEGKLRDVAALPKTGEEAIQPPGPTAIRHDRLKYVI